MGIVEVSLSGLCVAGLFIIVISAVGFYSWGKESVEKELDIEEPYAMAFVRSKNDIVEELNEFIDSVKKMEDGEQLAYIKDLQSRFNRACGYPLFWERKIK